MTESPDAGGTPEPDPRPRRRLWGVLAVIAVVGFVVLVVSSTRKATIPVGASGGMAGMSMRSGGADDVSMAMRDVDGRTVRIPDGRPGVIVFVATRGCEPCVTAVRAAARAVGRRGGGGELIVVSLDSGTTRSDLAGFARSAGRPRARYVVDDRNGSLASMFGASRLGATIVYDLRGKVVARPASAPAIGRALDRAAS